MKQLIAFDIFAVIVSLFLVGILTIEIVDFYEETKQAHATSALSNYLNESIQKSDAHKKFLSSLESAQ